MKTYITTFLLFISLATHAQETIINLENQFNYNTDMEPIYFKDVNNTLNKFVGNWIFDDGSQYLKIIITKKYHVALALPFYDDPNFKDHLAMTIIYKINGVEIYNTTTLPPPDQFIITGNLIINNNKVQLFYDEPTSSCYRQKSADLNLEFISDGTLTETGSLPSGTLQWNRVNTLNEGLTPLHTCPDGTLVDSSEYLIPANLTLERE